MLLYKTVSDQKEEFAETKEKNAAEQEALQAVADERFKTQLGEVVSCTWVSSLFNIVVLPSIIVPPQKFYTTKLYTTKKGCCVFNEDTIHCHCH